MNNDLCVTSDLLLSYEQLSFTNTLKNHIKNFSVVIHK